MEKPIADINSKKRRNFALMIFISSFVAYSLLVVFVYTYDGFPNYWSPIYAYVGFLAFLVVNEIGRRIRDKKYPKQLAPSEIGKF